MVGKGSQTHKLLRPMVGNGSETNKTLQPMVGKESETNKTLQPIVGKESELSVEINSYGKLQIANLKLSWMDMDERNLP